MDGFYQNHMYYSEHTFTAVPDIGDGQLRVYPNPSSDYVVFDIRDVSSAATVELFDSQGRRVLEHRLSGREPVPIGDLARGLYTGNGQRKDP